jgi:hypothetical protein
MTVGPEGNVVDAAGAPVTSNESPGSQVGAAAAGSSSSASSSNAGSTASGAAGVAGVDLWDSGWPTGRYYWTVVPVSAELPPTYDPSKADASGGLPIMYQDMAIPQDSCEAGLGMSFGKVSQPVVTADGGPYVSGLTPSGRYVASAGRTTATVHDSPLVAWQPAAGAGSYQVQLSPQLYPWRPLKTLATEATAIVLPLGKANIGTWYYRVRGVNPALPAGARMMSWSSVVKVDVTGDRFVVLGTEAAKTSTATDTAAAGAALLERVQQAYRGIKGAVETFRVGTVSIRITFALHAGTVVGEQAVARGPGGSRALVSRGSPTYVRQPRTSCWSAAARSSTLTIRDVGVPFFTAAGVTTGAPRRSAGGWQVSITTGGKHATLGIDGGSLLLRSIVQAVKGKAVAERVTNLRSTPTLLTPEPRC